MIFIPRCLNSNGKLVLRTILAKYFVVYLYFSTILFLQPKLYLQLYQFI